jgi:hypothetical protein
VAGKQVVQALQGESLTLCQAGSKSRRAGDQASEKRRRRPPGGVDAVLQAVTQVDQSEQELPLGMALDRRGTLPRAIKVALQSLAVLTQVVTEMPQFLERVLELARLQPQFVLQHRHLAEQSREIDRHRCRRE